MMYATRALRMFRPTLRMMRPVPKEEQAAHTISQRLRRLRNVPAELLPLGVVVGFAVFAAGYSITRHLVVDKTIRLKRQNRAADNAAHGHEGHAEHAEPAEPAEHAEPAVEQKE